MLKLQTTPRTCKEFGYSSYHVSTDYFDVYTVILISLFGNQAPNFYVARQILQKGLQVILALRLVERGSPRCDRGSYVYHGRPT